MGGPRAPPACCVDLKERKGAGLALRLQMDASRGVHLRVFFFFFLAKSDFVLTLTDDTWRVRLTYYFLINRRAAPPRPVAAARGNDARNAAKSALRDRRCLKRRAHA